MSRLLRYAVALAVLARAAAASPQGHPQLLRDVRPGVGGSRSGAGEASAAVHGRLVLFAADDGSTGLELWRTDGSPGGTALVLDVAPGPEGSNPSGLVSIAGGVLFRAVIGGEAALWRSDGTAAGTVEVKRFGPVGEGRDVVPLAATSRALLAADDGATGLEPWTSDGTTAGTRLLRDVRPGPDGSWPGPRRDVAVVGGTFYFTADDEAGGRTLWRTDGTVASTMPVVPSVAGAQATRLVAAGARLHFRLDVDGEVELWRTDGIGDTAIPVRGFGSSAAGAFLDGLTNADDEVLFVGGEAGGSPSVWRSDGTPSGTYALATTGDALPLVAGQLAGRSLFTRDDGTSGRELWSSDGTPAGTHLLVDLTPGPAGSTVHALHQLGAHVFFTASDASGPGLWRSDGTGAGTVLLQRFASDARGLLEAGGTLVLFAADEATGLEPWAVSVCGNGVVGEGESCDDGNALIGDGCAACVLEEHAAGMFIVTTDDPPDGASPDDPLETTVVAPVVGALEVLETIGDEELAGVRRLGPEAHVTAPPSTFALPLAVAFRLDASVLGGGPGDLVALRDGVRVHPCTGSGGMATPDPCIVAHDTLPDGDASIATLASSGGTWRFGRVGCSERPLRGCGDARSSRLALNGIPSGDTRMTWQWSGSVAPPLHEPGSEPDYAVCLYAGSDVDAPLARELVLPGDATCGNSSCWTARGAGLKFADREQRFGGVRLLKLAHAGRVTLKSVAPMPAALTAAEVPLTLQLQSNGGACWQAAFSSAGIDVPVPGRLRARADPCAGCVVDRNGDGHTVLACVGDSNTDDTPSIGAKKWCQRIADAEPSWIVHDASLWGVTAFPRPPLYPFHGRTFVDLALAADPPPDVLVIALGANDLLQNRSGLELRDALAELVARAGDVPTWVTLVTPDYLTPAVDRVIAANSMLGGFRTIDFFTGMTRTDLCADGLHVCASGQALMATRALEALSR